MEAECSQSKTLACSDCEITDLGKLALRMPSDLRCVRLVALALSLDCVVDGCLMAACKQAGDPFEVQSARMTSPLQKAVLHAKAIKQRRYYADGSGSDLIAARNVFVECLGKNKDYPQSVGLSMAKLQCFRSEAADIIGRLSSFLSELKAAYFRSRSSGPTFDTWIEQLKDVRTSLRKNSCLTKPLFSGRQDILTSLQLLAGAPSGVVSGRATMHMQRLNRLLHQKVCNATSGSAWKSLLTTVVALQLMIFAPSSVTFWVQTYIPVLPGQHEDERAR